MEESPHILIVDDDRELLRLLARFLERHGLRVTTARDGREMKHALTEWRIDQIVSNPGGSNEGTSTMSRYPFPDTRLNVKS